MGAITARNLIKKSLKGIRVLGVGQPVNSEVEQEAFEDLNNMLESWSLDNRKVFAETEEAETLTSGKPRYTVGSGGDFDTNRPIDVKDDAFIRDSGGSDHHVRILTQDIYRSMPNKPSTGRPRFATYTPEFPLGKFSFYPTPNDSTDVFHYRAKTLLESFATLTTEVTFAPGYQRAIIGSLAIEIASSKGKTVSAELIAVTTSALELIDRQNQLRTAMEPVKLDELSRLTGTRRTGTILTGPYG